MWGGHPAWVGVLLALLVPVQAWGAAGDPDPSFGVDGNVTTAIGNADNHANAVALQPDGKIIGVGFAFHSATADGFTNDDFAVVRYNSNGDLDPTFNGNGIVSTPIGTFKDIANASVVQADGKIIAAGGVYSSSVTGVFGLARYNVDGTLDPSFGGSGIVTTAIGSLAVITALELDRGGKIVAAGVTSLNGECQMAVARYNTDGSLDQGFGGTGVVTAAVGNHLCGEIGVAVQADGKVVVAGGIEQIRFVILRFNVDGSLDPSFNGAGKVITNVGGGAARVVAIQSDGKIVAAGYSRASATWEDFGLVRYIPNGSLDPSFGGTGNVTTSFGPGSDQIYGIAMQSDGKIVVAGFVQGKFAIARYDSDGTLDAIFGAGGEVTTNFGNPAQQALAVAIQSDGKIVAAGWTGQSNDSRFALARYLGDPVCGNGILDSDEQCDDANTLSSDGCDSTCQIEAGFACIGQPSVCTPLPSTTPTPTATPTMTATITATPSLTAMVTPFASPTATPRPLDHFTCYIVAATNGSARFPGIPMPPGVSLVDQFGSSTIAVRRPTVLCAPTNTLGEDPTAPTDPEHFTGFQVRNPTATVFPTNIKIVDQFNAGGLFVDAKKQSHLLVPTAKNSSATPPTPTVFVTDHFECYKIRVTAGTAKFIAVPGVTVQDQFGSMHVDVKKPKYLCTPVDKNGEDPSAPSHVNHLMCYQVKQVDPVPFMKIVGIFVNNQFGPEQFDAKKPSDLCVPALKNP